MTSKLVVLFLYCLIGTLKCVWVNSKALWQRSKQTFKLTLVFELDCVNTPDVSFLFSCEVLDARNSVPDPDENRQSNGLLHVSKHLHTRGREIL